MVDDFELDLALEARVYGWCSDVHSEAKTCQRTFPFDTSGNAGA
jgi:hypothetical protein